MQVNSVTASVYATVLGYFLWLLYPPHWLKKIFAVSAYFRIRWGTQSALGTVNEVEIDLSGYMCYLLWQGEWRNTPDEQTNENTVPGVSSLAQIQE